MPSMHGYRYTWLQFLIKSLYYCSPGKSNSSHKKKHWLDKIDSAKASTNYHNYLSMHNDQSVTRILHKPFPWSRQHTVLTYTKVIYRAWAKNTPPGVISLPGMLGNPISWNDCWWVPTLEHQRERRIPVRAQTPKRVLKYPSHSL